MNSVRMQLLPLPNFEENLQLGNEIRYDPKPGDSKFTFLNFGFQFQFRIFKNRQFGIQTSLLLAENGHSFLKAEYSVVNSVLLGVRCCHINVYWLQF